MYNKLKLKKIPKSASYFTSKNIGARKHKVSKERMPEQEVLKTEPE